MRFPEDRLFIYRRGQNKGEISKHVTNVKIDSSVKEIEREAFFTRSKLVFVEFENGVQIVGYDAFSNCRMLTHLSFPISLLDIRDDAISNCRNLMSVSLPKNLKWIGERTFADCTALKTIQIPSLVAEIRFRTFYNCRRLVSIELHEGLKCIRSQAFFGCNALKNLNIPSTVDIVEPDAFSECIKLQQRFPYPQELIDALRHRFHGLPIHQFCYTPIQVSSLTNIVETLNEMLRTTSDEHDDPRCHEKLQLLQVVDCLGMTPLHILALNSTNKSNAELMQTLLKAAVQDHRDTISGVLKLKELVYKKDRWGNSTLDYICMNMNSVLTSKDMMKFIIDMTVLSRLQWFGLDQWKDDIINMAEDFLNEYHHGNQEEHGRINNRSRPSVGRTTGSAILLEQLENIHSLLRKYERMEVTSLLECILWKIKIDQVVDVDIAAVEQSNSGRRKDCRIRCGSDIVISNVLHFL